MSAPTLALGLSGFTLRAWGSTDAQDMFEAIEHPAIARNMADWYPQTGYTMAMAQDWVAGAHAAMPGVNWAVAHQGRAVGAAGLHRMQGFARCNVEIGYWLAAAHWGRGVGTAIVRTLTQQAFVLSGVTRVFAPIHADNPGSQRVCEKNGFVLEGLRRKSVMKWGEAIDTAVWAAYADTWQPN